MSPTESLPADKYLALASLLLLAGCGPDPDMPMRKQTANAQTTQVEDNRRVEVTRIGVFRDDLAYGDLRGVYLIHDKETGEEFIGISGVGITVTGRHGCGKGCVREDER